MDKTLGLTPEILDRLEKLAEKYEAMGQDMVSYLDGLLYSNSLTYWDYVHLDTLLSLQTPRTDFEDEQIFIMYHQITELYFKLIRHELRQLRDSGGRVLEEWFKRLQRIINYFKNLTQSFDVMVEGMDPQQFLKFRMSLLPASGFQSAQYRQIEIESTSLRNLTRYELRPEISDDAMLIDRYEKLYWKSGNLELKTGKKTLTLRMFERKYDEKLLKLARKVEHKNLWTLYQRLSPADQDNEKLVEMLREYDLFANVFWSLSHYKSAVRYLQRDPNVIAATGGTNWQKFLPPRFQRIIYFPGLWSDKERQEWGKAWVLSLFREKVEVNWGKVNRKA
ncbi:MAG: tryptophan 2,3-dioxygenase family protein [Bacteroidota bacterium]